MKTFGAASMAAAALSGALYASTAAATLQPIVTKGSHFFYENGTEFFLKGIAYQQDFSTNGTGTAAGAEPDSFTDPLADEAGCKRDVPLLKELCINIIRVYAIDATKSHDACMKLLDDAGIYLIQDLSNPHASINRNEPAWNTELFETYAGVIDAMAKYTNTMGFFAGNEVSNVQSNTNASAFVKAAVRDSKAYIKAKNYRPIGVGYATNDDKDIRDDLKDYFNCGTSAESIDFWGYNIYSWCGDSSFQKSGYDLRTEEFSKYNVPAFFAEYGCNEVQPRVFTEVGALYGSQMTNVWSGGIMYMYFQEVNDYGVVEVKNGQASKLPDFTALKSQLVKATPSYTAMDAYKVTNTKAADCPATGTAWRASSNLPPVVNPDLCECMVKSRSCVANGDLSGDDIGEVFGIVCGLDSKACEGVARNPQTGVYGAYSMCSGIQQLSFVMDQYYKNQKSAADACSFDGKAKIQTPAKASGTCDNLVKAAGSAGTGTVTAVPTVGSGSSGSGSGSSSGSSSGASSSPSKSGNAAAGMTVPQFNVGMLQMGLYVVVAGLTGAGMVLL